MNRIGGTINSQLILIISILLIVNIITKASELYQQVGGTPRCPHATIPSPKLDGKPSKEVSNAVIQGKAQPLTLLPADSLDGPN